MLKQTEYGFLRFRTLFFSTGWMALKSRSYAPHSLISIILIMKNIYFIFSICERLFDELVKEWLQNRYSIVSGTFRVIDGRKVRVRKSHLRRKR